MTNKAPKMRLDKLLLERELCSSRTRAQALIMAGRVLVAGQRVDKPGTMVEADAAVVLQGDDHPYVSRGGVKLAAALEHFGRAPGEPLSVQGKVALDIGASTGGFTDCLLQHGAARVHAVDVGYGQLAWKLASDPRVVVHDRCNIRHLAPEALGEPVELVVIDCSFIASAKVLPHVPPFLAARADVVVLVKPQFELQPDAVGKGGIVRDPAQHVAAVEAATHAALLSGFAVHGHIPSPITGRDGNVEFLLWLSFDRDRATDGR